MKTKLKMTLKEADRYAIMKDVEAGKITLVKASEELKSSYRHTRRIWQRYQREGPEGLISKRRSRPSNHQLDGELREKALNLIRKRYPDYGPTLAAEKLEEKHELKLSKETVRMLMIQEGLWKPKRKKEQKVHARRTRRSCYGELVQLDGSYEYWFEDRAEKCCLLVTVDDATSKIPHMKFCRVETTEDYFRLIEEYIGKHGRPKAYYSDKHGIFRINAKESLRQQTTLGEGLKQLGIELICAHSPQAKGRVERANGILQDRLIKELREEKISSIEEGNRHLEKYRRKYNKKFGKRAASPEDVHRPLLPSQKLEEIFVEKTMRVVSKDLSFSYKNEIYQIESNYKHRLWGKRVEIHERDGEIKSVMLGGEKLKYKKWKERVTPVQQTIDVKELEVLWPTRKRKKPSRHHAWR